MAKKTAKGVGSKKSIPIRLLNPKPVENWVRLMFGPTAWVVFDIIESRPAAMTDNAAALARELIRFMVCTSISTACAKTPRQKCKRQAGLLDRRLLALM